MTRPFVSHDVVEIVLRLCEDTATPRALSVAILARYREWDQLVRLTVDPRDYTNPMAYYRDVVVTDFLRKVEDLPTSIDKKAVAEEVFFNCEKSCAASNARLFRFLPAHEYLNEPGDGHIADFLSAVRKKLAGVLGRLPDRIDGKFGPGATFADKGQYTTIPDKMSSCPTLTSDAKVFIPHWGETKWAQAHYARRGVLSEVRGNRFTTVPKDCTKDRGIAIEPSLNLFYQLGIGGLLKRRLLKAGLNLKDAQIIHRRVACEASNNGQFCTLDLSNASDTICTNLVKLVIPEVWADVLFALRSPYTLVKGKWVRLEKFSSMGNGFTFELETLIFFGIAAVCMERLGCEAVPHENIFVYGDDIIVPTHCAKDVIAALEFFGFSLNKKKSFVDGGFRESCGGDFFEGVNVRPFHLKKLPKEPHDFISMANGVRQLGLKNPRCFSHRNRYLRTWFRILDAIPSNIRRCRGPEDLGDIVIHDDEQRWNHRWRSSRRYIRVWRPHKHRKVMWNLFDPDVILAGALYGCGWGQGGVTPRDSVLSYKMGWSCYS